MVDDARLAAIDDDAGVQWSRYGLWAMGVVHALAAFVGGPFLGVSAIANLGLDASTGNVVGAVIAIGIIFVGFGLGFVHFLAAWGLAGGQRWAWMVTLALAGLAGLQCCLPVTGLFLWGMLNDRTRALFTPVNG